MIKAFLPTQMEIDGKENVEKGDLMANKLSIRNLKFLNTNSLFSSDGNIYNEIYLDG